MDLLKLLPILFIAYQPSSLVETRIIHQDRQLSQTAQSQPDYVPVFIAMGNSPPDVKALEAFYKREATVVADDKTSAIEEGSSTVTTAAVDDKVTSVDKSESSSTTTAAKVTANLDDDAIKKDVAMKDATTSQEQHHTDVSAAQSVETKPVSVRKVSHYEVTEEQQE